MIPRVLASILPAALVLPAALAAQAQQSPHALAGNLALVNDYRFRGLSQTYGQPAVQGGGDYTNTIGVYAGVWGSNVSGNQFLNGGSLELDVYGGFRKAAGPVNLDIGLLYYWYPGAKYNIDPGDQYNTAEVYLGASYGPVAAKYSYALTDLFGMNGATIGGFCGINEDGSQASGDCLGTGDTKGSGYLDVTGSFSVGSGVGLVLHFGRQWVSNYDELSYSDYKVAVTRPVVGVNLGLAVVGTDAEDRFYRFTPTSGGSETEYVGETTVVFSVGKTF